MAYGRLLCAALMAALASCQAKPEAQDRAQPIAEAPPSVTTTGHRTTFASPQILETAPGVGSRAVRSVLHVPRKMQFGEFVWDDRGVAPAETWVRVDLRSQLISVFRGENEIGTAVILYGTDHTATPTGEFPILAKMRKHRSSLYDAPMPFTLRLTGDGISIHGSEVRWGAATHGCVGVPVKFAEKLFDEVATGTRVVIVDRRIT